MDAGRLRHRITIKAPPDPSLPGAQNEYGETIAPWIVVTTLRASKDPLIGNEYYAAESAQSKVEVKFRARYIAGIDNTMQVHHGSEVYEILSAINVEERGRELLIYAKKVT